MLVKRLEEKAREVRQDIIKSIYTAKSGHPGGSLSITDILIALYFHVMKHDPSNPKWPARDRFILSKGHACPALYAVLSETGYFPKECIWDLRKCGGICQGHPDMSKTPGVEASSGSEGQGLSIGIGMALAGKLDRKFYTIYVGLGDGEMNCGQIWEAAMFASFHKLDNLVAIIDRNRLQLDGPTEQILSIEPLSDKWKAFGWNVIDINGHDMAEILMALDAQKHVNGKPTVIIAHTIKGKGVSFMEGVVGFHGKAPNDEQYAQAMKELGGQP